MFMVLMKFIKYYWKKCYLNLTIAISIYKFIYYNDFAMLWAIFINFICINCKTQNDSIIDDATHISFVVARFIVLFDCFISRFGILLIIVIWHSTQTHSYLIYRLAHESIFAFKPNPNESNLIIKNLYERSKNIFSFSLISFVPN